MKLIGRVVRQYRTFRPVIATKNVLYGLTEREKRKSFGPANADDTFYVIRCINSASRFHNGPVLNLLANHSYVLSHLHHAYEHGYLPVVDQLNYPVYNTPAQPINGTRNPWEFFWEQPGGHTLAEAYESRHVILSQRNWISEWNLGYDIARHKDPGTIGHLHKLSETVPLNAATRAHVESSWQENLARFSRILGVNYRFSWHSKGSAQKAPGHPIQPEIDALLAAVLKRCEAWDIDAVFFATESEDAVNYFRSALGPRLVTLRRVRRKDDAVYNEQNPNPMYTPGAMYQTALDYLTEMELLARCTALMGSITSGLRYAIIRNNAAYEHLDIPDLGLFPDTRRKRTK